MKVAIVGAGKLGMAVTNTLLGGDHAVTIIDTDESLLQKVYRFRRADALDRQGAKSVFLYRNAGSADGNGRHSPASVSSLCTTIIAHPAPHEKRNLTSAKKQLTNPFPCGKIIRHLGL